MAKQRIGVAHHGDIWVSTCGKMELRCGPWQEVLTGVECDALITDPPYSVHTHEGNDSMGDYGNRATLSGYTCLDESGVSELVDSWSHRTHGWFVAMTDDALSWTFRSKLHESGRFAFASVSLIQHRPRLAGDGPGSCTVHIQTARPRNKHFYNWGSLPGWYKDNPVRGAIVNGAKPLRVMRAIIRDYTRPGDLVCDPYAGGGTTLLAAAMEGRRAIGAELDPETFTKAVRRLQGGYTQNLFV